MGRTVGGLTAPATTAWEAEPWAEDLGAAAVAALDPHPGEGILQVGCGTGSLALTLAGMVAPSGWVVAVEAAAGLVGEAAQRARSEGLPVEFRVSDLAGPHHLARRPGAALLVRALSRSRDPAATLAEAVRCLPPGGRVVAAEPDWDGVEIDHPDPVMTRRVLSPLRMGVVHPGLAARLAGLLTGAGVTGVGLSHGVAVARGRAQIDALLQARAAALAPAEPDGVPAAAARLWWAAFLTADARAPLVARLPGIVAMGTVAAA